MTESEITEIIIGSAIKVHKALSTGLLESDMKNVCVMNYVILN